MNEKAARADECRRLADILACEAMVLRAHHPNRSTKRYAEVKDQLATRLRSRADDLDPKTPSLPAAMAALVLAEATWDGEPSWDQLSSRAKQEVARQPRFARAAQQLDRMGLLRPVESDTDDDTYQSNE